MFQFLKHGKRNYSKRGLLNLTIFLRDLKAQAGYWFQQPAKNKKRVKTGTDILKKSLDSTQYDTSKTDCRFRFDDLRSNS